MRHGDLQIGDYVIVHDYGRFHEWKHDMVMVVTSIDFSVVGCAGLDEHNVMQHSTFLLSQIEPIPITIEFLKKNFPEYEEGYEIGWWHKDDCGDESKGFMVEFRNDNIEILMRNVHYVHEVQHIVKMGGLQKEIKL